MATKRWEHRGIGMAAAVLVGLTTLGTTMSVAQAAETTGSASGPIGGRDRYDTAAQLATTYWSNPSTVIVANGESGVDALTASYLAGVKDAPVLLTPAKSVSDYTVAAIAKLDPAKVIVIGGEGAVSPAVFAELTKGRDSQRITGADRYETAANIVAAAGEQPTTVFLAAGSSASGGLSADALAAGPIAYRAHIPILLTQAGELPAATKKALGSKQIQLKASGQLEKVVVVGGLAAISDLVKGQISTLTGAESTRVSGPDRSGTAASLAESVEAKQAEFDPSTVSVVNGASVDGLTAGPASGKRGAAMLLTNNSTDLGAGTEQFLTEHADQLQSVTVVGGSSSVPSALVQKVSAAADVRIPVNQAPVVSAPVPTTPAPAPTAGQNPAVEDSVAPALVTDGAVVNGNEITLTFTEPLSLEGGDHVGGYPYPNYFRVSLNDLGDVVRPNASDVVGNKLVLTLPFAVPAGLTPTISYDQPPQGSLQDAKGNRTPSFAAVALRNETAGDPDRRGPQMLGPQDPMKIAANSGPSGWFDEVISGRTTGVLRQVTDAAGEDVNVMVEGRVESWLSNGAFFTPTTVLVPGASYVLTWSAVDLAGNESTVDQEFLAIHSMPLNVRVQQSVDSDGVVTVNGTFDVENLPTGQVRVLAQRQGEFGERAVSATAEDLAAGRFSDAGLTPGTWSYRVCAGPEGSPIESCSTNGARIVVEAPEQLLAAPTVDGWSGTDLRVAQRSITVTGTAAPGSRVTVTLTNTRWSSTSPVETVAVGDDGRYSVVVELSEEHQTVNVRSTKDDLTSREIRVGVVSDTRTDWPDVYSFDDEGNFFDRGDAVITADSAEFVLTGWAEIGARLKVHQGVDVDGAIVVQDIATHSDGYFDIPLSLSQGDNIFTLVAIDDLGNVSEPRTVVVRLLG